VPLPEQIRNILSADTAESWELLAPAVPKEAYLVGGTAIALHLGHRISRDLDFFYHHNAIDLDQLARAIATRGPFAITRREPGTLNAVFSQTKIQFLHADEVAPQRLLAVPVEVGGVRVAGLEDLLAMKLKVIGDRGELRDYFDLMAIEQRTGRSVEEGLQLFVARYQPAYPQQALGHIVRSLGYFDDIEADDQLPVSRQTIVDYWTNRHPSVIAALGRIPP
jgi:nucleotidyltransferase AbiEii toxin of type IV toxin-antitoxin system